MPEASTPAPLAAGTRLPNWAREIGQRIRRHLVIKTLGITGFIWLFFVAYFHLLRHPAYPVTTMPLTAVDRLLPFEPAGLGVYLTLWFYVGIAPALLNSMRELLAYGAWAALFALSGLACFYFWPNSVPPEFVAAGRDPALALLAGVDAAGNACPSMHVASAVFTGWQLQALLRQIGTPAALRWLNWAWVGAIAWSTVAIRQHVALDVLAGAVLGTFFALPLLWRRPFG